MNELSEQLIDNRGLACPQPVINTKRALDSLTEGTIVSVVDNETAKENVSRLAASQGLDCRIEEKEGLYYLHITKTAAAPTGQPSSQTPIAPEPTVWRLYTSDAADEEESAGLG